MKFKNLFVAVLALFAWVACSKDEVPRKEEIGEASLSLQVKAPQQRTKATATVDEVGVKRLFVAVFNQEGTSLLVSREVENTTSISDLKPVPTAPVKVLLVANAPAGIFNGLQTVDEFKAATGQLSDETEVLTMSTSVFTTSALIPGVNSIGTGEGHILQANPMSLYRNVASIALTKIIINPVQDFAKNASFTLKSVFLANVKDKSHYLSAEAWGAVEADEATFLCGDEAWLKAVGEYKEGEAVYAVGLNHLYDASIQPITPAEGNNQISGEIINAPFYVYENIKEEKNHTLLIIKGDYSYTTGNEVSVDVKDCYYTVIVNRPNPDKPVPSNVVAHDYVKRNVAYTIDVNLKGPGGPGPYDPSGPTTLTVAVEVAAWGKITDSPSID